MRCASCQKWHGKTWREYAALAVDWSNGEIQPVWVELSEKPDDASGLGVCSRSSVRRVTRTTDTCGEYAAVTA